MCRGVGGTGGKVLDNVGAVMKRDVFSYKGKGRGRRGRVVHGGKGRGSKRGLGSR